MWFLNLDTYHGEDETIYVRHTFFGQSHHEVVDKLAQHVRVDGLLSEVCGQIDVSDLVGQSGSIVVSDDPPYFATAAWGIVGGSQ